MKYKYQYFSEEEKQILINNNVNKVSTEEQNIAEGNFLIFADEASIPIDQRLTTIEDTQDLILLKLEGVII